MPDLPLLRTVLHPPDALGRSELHCFITKRGYLTEEPEVIEDLGRIPYRPYPEKSYESIWIGEDAERRLEVTLPDGRRLEVYGVAASIAEGNWPQKKENGKKKRGRKKKAAGQEQPATLKPKKHTYTQLTLDGLK